MIECAAGEEKETRERERAWGRGGIAWLVLCSLGEGVKGNRGREEQADTLHLNIREMGTCLGEHRDLSPTAEKGQITGKMPSLVSGVIWRESEGERLLSRHMVPVSDRALI